MRLLDTEVKYFDRDTYKIPEYGNTWGCIVDYLDTCLVNGTEGQEVLSITTTDDPDHPGEYWLSKIMLNPGHGFKENLSVIEITECSEPVYNGVHRVQEVGEDYIFIALETAIVPEQPKNVTFTTGMSINQPPLGFEKPYSEPQKAVYKVTTKEGKICYLRVDNSCPEGHDPSHAKFARVSMFEHMENIDDYHYKRNRKKCPVYLGDEDRVEEGVYQVWFSTGHSYRYVHARTPPNVGNSHVHLIGDSSTFYLYYQKLWHNWQGYDEVYCFGKYEKFCYLEDPLPFILRTSRAESKGSHVFSNYSQYQSIVRDRDWCNNTFSTEPENMLFSNNSDRFALLLNDSYRSGYDSRLNFKPYQNELPINISDMDLRFFRPGNTVLEGKYRGTKMILNNFRDNWNLAPRELKVFNRNDKFFLYVTARNDSSSDQRMLFEMNNWSSK